MSLFKNMFASSFAAESDDDVEMEAVSSTLVKSAGKTPREELPAPSEDSENLVCFVNVLFKGSLFQI